ncbi:hypothetical protein [Microbacterium sp. 179-I 3D4 NHS]|uniref:DUF7882 family protein n=1 Tax=Microbacterium sp. 179-I 3D4 NHS TaxID=3142381 RepID=UPI00399F75F4
MGRLKYDGTSDPILVDDVTLAHLKIVIGTKLRRQESFMMSWVPREGGENRRMSAWIHPAIPLQFGFDAEEPPAIDAHRIADIMHHVNASGELSLEHISPPA